MSRMAKTKKMKEKSDSEKKKDETTDSTTAPAKSATTDDPNTAASVPLITVGSERVPVMVIYKGKKASRAMVQKILGKRKETAEKSSEKEKSNRIVPQPSPNDAIPIPDGCKKYRLLSPAKLIFGTLLLALCALGTIVGFIGLIMYSVSEKSLPNFEFE